MTQIKVFTKEDIEGGYNGTLLSHLRPRMYMLAYSFEQLMKYAKEELYWADIEEDEVMGFEIFNKEEQWTNYIKREIVRKEYRVVGKIRTHRGVETFSDNGFASYEGAKITLESIKEQQKVVEAEIICIER